jgi:hypothetical protein
MLSHEGNDKNVDQKQDNPRIQLDDQEVPMEYFGQYRHHFTWLPDV